MYARNWRTVNTLLPGILPCIRPAMSRRNTYFGVGRWKSRGSCAKRRSFRNSLQQSYTMECRLHSGIEHTQTHVFIGPFHTGNIQLWVRGFAYGKHRVVDSHYAVCTLSQVPHSDTYVSKVSAGNTERCT